MGTPTVPPDDTPPPRLRRVLCAHVTAAVLIQSTAVGVMSVLPVLARREFGAGDAQTLLITAAIPTFLSLSIFWHALLRRTTLRAYLLIHWLSALLPLGFVGLAQSYWHVLACHLLGAVGAAGATPVYGDLLKRFYPDSWRGRAFGVIQGAVLAGGMASAYAVGAWLNADAGAFRLYMPLAALLQLCGIGLLARLARVTRAEERRTRQTGRIELGRILQPIAHLYAVLRANRAFFHYEAAFMTYGVGWMICFALLPILGTTKLGLTYAEYQNSTQVVFQGCMLVAILPVGWIVDRVGAIQTCAMAFTLLVLYPVGLMLAGGYSGVLLASAVYGLAMAGVNHAWTLGPVAFAATPEDAAQYAAIHATMVGIRGVLFQGLGIAVYKLSGSLTWPLAIACGGFAWAAYQMWQLHRRTRRTLVAAPGAATPRETGATLRGAVALEPAEVP